MLLLLLLLLSLLLLQSNLDAPGVSASETGGETGEETEEGGGRFARRVGLMEYLLFPFVSKAPAPFSPYNRGWKANLQQLLGSRPWLLIVAPWVRLPQEDLFQ